MVPAAAQHANTATILTARRHGIGAETARAGDVMKPAAVPSSGNEFSAHQEDGRSRAES